MCNLYLQGPWLAVGGSWARWWAGCRVLWCWAWSWTLWSGAPWLRSSRPGKIGNCWLDLERRRRSLLTAAFLATSFLDQEEEQNEERDTEMIQNMCSSGSSYVCLALNKLHVRFQRLCWHVVLLTKSDNIHRSLFPTPEQNCVGVEEGSSKIDSASNRQAVHLSSYCV